MKEILGLATLGLRIANVERWHQLIVAGAIKGVVRHQGDFGRQLEAFQRFCELQCVERLFLIGNQRASSYRNESEPCPSRRDLAGRFLMADTNSATCGTPGCFQYHSNTHVPMRASGGPFEHFELLLCPGNVEFLVKSELDSLLQ